MAQTPAVQQYSSSYNALPRSNNDIAGQTLNTMFGPLIPAVLKRNVGEAFYSRSTATGGPAKPSAEYVANRGAVSMLQSMYCTPIAAAVAMGPKWQAHVIEQPAATSSIEDIPVAPVAPVSAKEKSAPRSDSVRSVPKKPVKQPHVCSSTTSHKGSAGSKKSKASIPASRAGSSGRPPRAVMANESRKHLTSERIEELGKCNDHCQCKHGNCLHREDLQSMQNLGTNIHMLWDRFNSKTPGHHKGQALLDYMYENEMVVGGVFKKIGWKLFPGSPDYVCESCWRICAGFSKPSGKESGVYDRMRILFNAGDTNGIYEQERDFDKSGDVKKKLSLAIDVFLETWLKDNSDEIPEDMASFNDLGKKRVHVDVARKRDIWDACCLYLERNYPELKGKAKRGKDGKPCSKDWFIKRLNNKVKVVIHKHKKFSQCVTCFLFKQLMAKCTNPADKKEIRAHRKRHFDTVFGERVIYHMSRHWAKDNPEQALSIILDGQTKWRTCGPTMSRQLGSGFHPDFEAFGQQLYGCLVHSRANDEAHKGGFFGYMVDDSVRGGGNVTCEIIYNTLLKLQETREVWPPLCDIRLDNTTKDNKNKCVFGFMGWLVLTDVFKTLRVRYLSVGHTHEDIDALFGVLMQHLYRGRCFETIEILMQEIYDSFFLTDNFHASDNRPSVEVEHMRATHDWTTLLTTAVEKAAGFCDETGAAGETGATNAKTKKPKPAVAKLEKYARRVPDSFRPHEFVFEKAQVEGNTCVVLNYKHWSKDQAYWNKNPIVVFNHAPDVKDLKPSQLSKQVTTPLEKCAAYPTFEDHSLLCCKRKGPVGEDGVAAPSNLGKCPRCKVQVAFADEYSSSDLFEKEHHDAWAKRWATTTQECANASLTEVKELRRYTLQEPRLPYVLPNRMQGPSDAYLSVEPCLFEGYTESMYQKLLEKAGVGAVSGSVSSFAVEDVVAARIDRKGNVRVAIVWANDDTDGGGSWQDLDAVNTLFEIEQAGDDSTTDGEGPQPTAAELEAVLEKSLQRQNWNTYFGRDLDEDLDVLVGYTKGKDTTVYAGVIKAFDDDTGLQTVYFPVAEANAFLGTADQPVADDNIDIRLDTLQCTECISFWVKTNFAGLPFIKEELSSLRLDTGPEPKKSRVRRRRNTISSDESDFEEVTAHKAKKTKPLAKKKKHTDTTVRATLKSKKPTEKQKTKKPTKEQDRQSLLKQMRHTPM
jgi:hypothetical protein